MKMKMKVLNTTTHTIVELPSLIDPKSGCDWVRDYVGNAISPDFIASVETCEKYGDEISYQMGGEDLIWWTSQIKKMQEATDMLNDCRNCECWSEEDYHNSISGCEFNDLPSAIIAYCNDLKGESN